MDEFDLLDVFLHDEKIGVITRLPGDKNVFTFTPDYIKKSSRAILSLSFEDTFRNLIVDVKSTRTRLPPFFSNLLPEGPLRDYLASQSGVSTEREFYLLQALGSDLPGAVKVLPSKPNQPLLKTPSEGSSKRKTNNGILHFSLAGVQLKFSAIWKRGGRLTIPVDGVGGSWIVKLPSTLYPGVPENEYAMMELARKMGMNVPATALIPIEDISGIPSPLRQSSSMAYAIERFDRTSQGGAVHMEDLAQVFGVYPEKKYTAASYRNIAEVVWTETGEKGMIEFIRRFVFNALIGNGDMHLKNWSLIYPDRKTPQLAPSYDFVSTLPYLPGDQLALNFVDSKAFTSLTLDQFKRFAAKAKLPEALVLDTTQQTVREFKKLWSSIEDYSLDKALIRTIETHFKTLPFAH